VKVFTCEGIAYGFQTEERQKRNKKDRSYNKAGISKIWKK
jgi:hypothetical protein